MTIPRILALLPLAIGWLSANASGQPLVYEPWDLTRSNGSSVVGLAGESSFGFSSTGWDFALGGGTATYDATGLSYADAQGNELVTTGGAVSIAANVVNTRWARGLTSPLDDRPDEYFVSFLLRLDSPLAGDAFWTSDGVADKGAVGFQAGQSLRFVNGPSSNISASQGETKFLVARIVRDNDNGTNGDGDQDFAELWVDPILTNPGAPLATFSTGSISSNRIRDATAAIFKLNAVNSGSYTIDEFRIGEAFSDVSTFVAAPSLYLEVDVEFGEIRLINDSATAYRVAAYEITSESGGLSASRYLPLEAQNRMDFPAGDGTGNGWEVVGLPGDGYLAEQFLIDSSELAIGGELTLGAAYNVEAAKRDIKASVLLEDGTKLPISLVVYQDSTDAVPGDYNSDAVVDLADYTMWRDTLGSQVPSGSGADGNSDGVVNAADWAVWRLYFGERLQANSPVAIGVPEPTSSAQAALAAVLLCGAFICRCSWKPWRNCHPSGRNSPQDGPMLKALTVNWTATSVLLMCVLAGHSLAQQPESIYPPYCQQDLQDWLPYPAKTDFMVVTAHPDDEGIFFGGALPYYTQVRNKSTVLIGMTGSERNSSGFNRLEELERAAWHYGVRYQPVNFQYSDASSDVMNAWEPLEGAQGVINRLASEIRRFKPDVLLTHDFNGEYGHQAHQITASSLAAAFDAAADPLLELDGLAPWQAQKIYIHRYNNPGGNAAVPSTTVNPSTGYMYHSWEETFDELGGKSSRDIANEALKCHQDPIRIWPDLQVSSRHVVGEQFDGHHAEDWGLYATKVGPDSIDSDFFQHVVDDIFMPTVFGDLDGSNTLTVEDWRRFKPHAGENLAGLSREAAYLRGDMDFDGDNDIVDFGIFRTLYNREHGEGAFASIAAVPEPRWQSLIAAAAMVAVAAFRRGGSRQS